MMLDIVGEEPKLILWYNKELILKYTLLHFYMKKENISLQHGIEITFTFFIE
jgi:hypothetical protein